MAFEVIIVLNGSPRAVERFVLESVTGATVVESNVNRGVAGGYNLGRESARGEFIVLLHDDVEVWPGWLEALVRAADEMPEVGAVGSRALNPDGTLQSAGAIVRPNGTTEALGRGEPGDSPRYRTRRHVDYSGSYALLVRAVTWDAVGGLDERFFPAYHVDVDLGMRIREHGQFVLYEPRSQVTHHRWGVTKEHSFRLFAAHRNLQRFVEKWHSASRPSASPEQGPQSDADYLRLDLALKEAYIADLERRCDAMSDDAREAEELRQQLAAVKSSPFWRLHGRLRTMLRRM